MLHADDKKRIQAKLMTQDDYDMVTLGSQSKQSRYYSTFK